MEAKVQEKTVRWEDLEVVPEENKCLSFAEHEKMLVESTPRSFAEMYQGTFPSITEVSDEELEEARKALAEDHRRMLLRGAVLFAHGVNAEDFAKALETVSKSAEKASISFRDIAIFSSEFPPMGTCTPCQIALTGNPNGD